ncbi:hypothetical protein [Vulcanisaeta sp. JCM 16159]|uniref:hypothetical protein n=1 Tax=Vulcanisaeta sp. JCM 16159 TaxID=1295371 RepID=UPI0006D173B6|nr:hypothetical protein [Vulcanisaeta sp. JCM 16159]
MSEPVPIHAEGIFTMGVDGGVWENLIFEYLDKDHYYRDLLRNREGSLNELRTVMRNMQGFLDEETIKINDEIVRARVIDVSLGFRGSFDRPYLEFYIYFKGNLRKGINKYEDYYEEEITEYDYEIVWLFPPGFRIIEYEFAGEGSVMGGGNILRLIVRKGLKVGNYESITFEVP